MVDMETAGPSKRDSCRDFAKALPVDDYAAETASTKPNAARPKSLTALKPADLTDRTELGATPLAAVFIAMRGFVTDKDPEGRHRQPERCSPALFSPPPAADGDDRLHPGQGPRTRDPARAEAISSRMRNQRLQ
jgi:putative DNA methylase